MSEISGQLKGIKEKSSSMMSVILILLAAALIVNLFTLARSYAAPTLKQVWQLRDSPAWERAAYLLEGGRFGGFVSFVRDTTPEDARVILPPQQPPRVTAHVDLMQYFLYPRDIHNCGINEVEACILRVTGPNTYILSVRGFPPRDLAEESKRLIPYQDELGIYAPR
jgi:hypothetical protein